MNLRRSDPFRGYPRRYVRVLDDREDNHEFRTHDISLVHAKSLHSGVRRLWRGHCRGDVVHILLRLRNTDHSGLGLKARVVFDVDSEALTMRNSDGSVETHPGRQVHLVVLSKKFARVSPHSFSGDASGAEGIVWTSRGDRVNTCPMRRKSSCHRKKPLPTGSLRSCDVLPVVS